MPWLSADITMQESSKKRLTMICKVKTVPHVAVFNPSAELIAIDGYAQIQKDPIGVKFPWKQKTLDDIWPEHITGKGGKISSSTFDNKYLMLYFSADWCPHSKGITPILSKAYRELKEKRDNFELIFVSYDEDEDSFTNNFQKMPFCAIPYGERKVVQDLSNLFEIEDIPALITLGPIPEDGGNRPLISNDIRHLISNG